MKFRYIKEQRDMFQGQFEIINVSLGNIMNTKITLENLKKGINQDDEILVPIGGIANIKASIKDTEKILLAVTQDVVIEKDLDGAIEFIDKMIEQHKNQLQFLRGQLQNLDKSLQEISQQIQNG
ncbi:MAG: prefoldin subunit alpha [Promethearchaeota archaeon]|nr:MAG: prefoldin subunit alpha [Candidatus Lokiarchaeota archaeon]